MALSIQKSLEAYGLDSYHKGRHEWGLLLGWDSTCICPLQHIRKQIMIWLTHNIYTYMFVSSHQYICTHVHGASQKGCDQHSYVYLPLPKECYNENCKFFKNNCLAFAKFGCCISVHYTGLK